MALTRIYKLELLLSLLSPFSVELYEQEVHPGMLSQGARVMQWLPGDRR